MFVILSYNLMGSIIAGDVSAIPRQDRYLVFQSILSIYFGTLRYHHLSNSISGSSTLTMIRGCAVLQEEKKQQLIRLHKYPSGLA
jgi:hypothetical protein